MCTRIVVAGASLAADVRLDGKDPLPLLTRGAPSPHRSLYFTFRTHAALRQGDWKIVRERPDQPWQLFHLTEDVSEQHDLADQRPDKLRELQSTFAEWQATF